MNSSGKQSFYEIQLSNGSLIIAFLAAVGLGVGVFMLGVMVGRGQSPQVVDDGGWVEQFPEDATAAAEEPAPDPEFFDKVQESDEPAPAAVGAPAGGAPAVQERGGEDGGGEEPPPNPTVPEPAAAGLPAADPALPSGFMIQVKSTPSREDADALQAALSAAGFPAYVFQGDVSGRTFYRVRVGRYRSESDAQVVEKALKGRPDVEETWITQG